MLPSMVLQTFTFLLLSLIASQAKEYKTLLPVPHFPMERSADAVNVATSTTPIAIPSEQATSDTSSGGSSSTQPPKENFPAIAPADASSDLPILLPPLPDGDVASEEAQRRRIVSYDQRQEGQYNIRADLENFMIVLIPPGPQEGLSLLDLLTKSLRGSGLSKSKRKHFTGHKGTPLSLKSFYQRQPGLDAGRGYQTPHLAILNERESSLPEYIEGRTPYHVDISASDDEQARLHPERQQQQVDVLPPPYYPHLIKPFHLEAEPTIIQTLPPAELTGNSNQASSAQYYRSSRSVRGDNFLESNRLPGSELNEGGNARAIAMPIYRKEFNAHANELYPPIDLPAFILGDAQARSWHLDDEPTPVPQPKQILAFDLLGDTLADSKTLIRDGLARCAPGQRRDSYGICREIEGY